MKPLIPPVSFTFSTGNSISMQVQCIIQCGIQSHSCCLMSVKSLKWKTSSFQVYVLSCSGKTRARGERKTKKDITWIVFPGCASLLGALYLWPYLLKTALLNALPLQKRTCRLPTSSWLTYNRQYNWDESPSDPQTFHCPFHCIVNKFIQHLITLAQSLLDYKVFKGDNLHV